MSVELYGRIQKQQVRSRKVRRQFSIEHSLRYSDGIANLDVTETLMPDSACRIVQPNMTLMDIDTQTIKLCFYIEY